MERPCSFNKICYALQSTHAAEALRNKDDQTTSPRKTSPLRLAAFASPGPASPVPRHSTRALGATWSCAQLQPRGHPARGKGNAPGQLTQTQMWYSFFFFFGWGQCQGHFALAKAAVKSFCLVLLLSCQQSGQDLNSSNNLGKTPANWGCLLPPASACTASGTLLMRLNMKRSNYAILQSEN